ncbi:hypothetical protein J437_LFUL005791 [Ladona fulva]|uniref:Ig-like domain-containing protein n=1 Tax=Ladona fulva TaxID=123851 RepID=A0A8K0K281_LADFU|nr:hypothetical protein J437_LFUL005791 [Ladona fulva]
MFAWSADAGGLRELVRKGKAPSRSIRSLTLPGCLLFPCDWKEASGKGLRALFNLYPCDCAEHPIQCVASQWCLKKRRSHLAELKKEAGLIRTRSPATHSHDGCSAALIWNGSRNYDARRKNSEKVSHWKEKDLVDERAYFRTITEPATLSIDSVEERDEGEYRCRVDFRKSPTRNTKVRLTVIGE